MILTGLQVTSGISQTELTLQDALKLSSQHSPALQSLRHDSISAAYELAAARALLFPTVSVNAAAFYVDDIQTIPLAMQRLEIGTQDNYQTDLKLSFPLFTAGRISRQVSMYRQMAQMKTAALDAEKLRIACATRRAYLQLMLSRVALRTASTSLRRIRIINQDVLNLFAAGLADSVDLLDADLQMQRIARQIDERETTAKNASSALAKLTGLDLMQPIALADSLPDPDSPPQENLESMLLTVQRPELKLLEYQGLAAACAADVARASSFPSLSGFAGYSYGKPNKDMFNKTWNDYWSVGLNLNWEWNLGGRSVQSTQAAREIVTSVEMARQELEEAFILQARTAHENVSSSYRTLHISRKELSLVTRQFRLATEKQKAGSLSINRLLELEADLEAAEQRYQADIINYFLAEAEYLQAIGSGKLLGGF